MAMNFLIARFAPKGMKKISYIDTSTLRIYRNLIEAGFNEIYFDDIKTVRFKENSSLPYFSEVTIIVPEDKLPEIANVINAFETYLEKEYGPESPEYNPEINFEAYEVLLGGYVDDRLIEAQYGIE
ncbi:MAG: hypothetical protein Q4C42_02955 [Clostridia bacterium]|nr:hypothetical protein [Clostridia bacterium]